MSKQNEKRQSVLSRLLPYIGDRKFIYLSSMVLASLSAIVSMLSFIAIWMIIRRLLIPSLALTGLSTTTIAWGIFVMAALGILFYFFSLWCSHISAFRVERNIRYRAMEQTVHKPLGFFANENTGKMRKVLDDNASITHTFVAHQVPDLFVGIFCLISTFIFIFAVDWRMGLVSLIPVIIIIGVFISFMGPSYKKTMGMYMNFQENMNNEAVEYVRGIPVVKAFQQTVYSFKRFHDAIMQYNKWASRYTKECRNGMTIYTIASNSFAFLLVPLAISLISHGEDWRLVSVNLLFYMLVTPFFSQSLMKLMYMMAGMNQADEAITRIETLLSEGPDITDPKVSDTIQSYDISISNVKFRYKEDEGDVLKGISLDIPSGSKIALIGSSGGGKTTLARLIARFWDVTEGSIKIGGVDIRHITQKELMGMISFVFQQGELFKASIRDNLLFGNPSASEAEINEALKLAQADTLVENLPNGLDTVIGPQGTYLSGGEQQRIILARAFLKNAPILLLDEATAYADPENEHEIQQALRHLMEGKTVIMIAHRLSSVKEVDQIVVLKDGEIIESGQHEELLSQQGVYTSMREEYKQATEWKLGKEVSK